MKSTLHVGLSYACNMNCKHCFVDRNQDNLSIEKLKEIISYLYAEQGLFNVFYTFGEPLLSSSLEEVVRYCNELGLVQILMTNGSLVNKKVASNIKSWGINRAYVSIDSSVLSEHDSNRNYVGAFDLAIEAIKVLKTELSSVGIASTINSSNQNKCFEIWKLANDLNVNMVSFLRERKNGRVQKNGHFDEYYSFVMWYLLNSKNQKVNLFTHDSELIPIIKRNKDIICNELLVDKYITMNQCHLSNTISIAPNGNVSFCNLCGTTIGNINCDDIKKIILKGEESNECFICNC